MAGILSGAGSYRRTVLAVALTGTVCAGVGFMVYAGVKKLQGRKRSLSGKDTGAGVKTTVLAEKEPAQNQLKDILENSDKTEPKPEPVISIKVDEPIPVPIQPQAPEFEMAPAQSSATPPPARNPKYEETKISEPSPIVTELGKDKVSKGVIAKVETIVSAATESAIAEVTTAVSVVAPSQMKDAMEKKSAKHDDKELMKDPLDNIVVEKEVITDVEKVMVNAVAASPASGCQTSSLSNLDSWSNSGIIIEDVKKVEVADDGTKPARQKDEDMSDSIRDVLVSVALPAVHILPEQQDTDAPASAGGMSSHGDDVEIMCVSHASTDTTKMTDSAVSWNFRCGELDVEQSNDLSQSSEIVNMPGEGEEEQDYVEEEKVRREATQVKKVETSGDSEHSNIDFQLPRSTVKTPVVDETKPAQTEIKDIQERSDKGEPLSITVEEPIPISSQPKTPEPETSPAQPPTTLATAKKLKHDENETPHQAKDTVAKGFSANVETIVSAVTESAKAEVTTVVSAPVASPMKDVENVAANDGKKIVKDVESEAAKDVKVTVKEVTVSPVSHDGQLKFDSHCDSEIAIIKGVEKKVEVLDEITKPASHMVEDAGDFVRDVPAPLVIPIVDTSSEQQDTDAPASMGAQSSLVDDLEIIHDSPASTDTTDTTDSVVSGDFIKCGAADMEQSMDFSQSIEIIKVPAAEDDNKNKQMVASEATQVKEMGISRDSEDDNANFQLASSTETAVSDPVLPIKEINQNNPGEKNPGEKI